MLFGQKENSNGLKRKAHINKRELRNRMNNWKIISKISVIFSIIFIVFAAIAAIINYQSLIIQYSMVPTNFITVSILSAMLPFILFAVLSFVVAAIGSRAAKEKAENEISIQKQEPTIDKET
jgi:hypothetical protein